MALDFTQFIAVIVLATLLAIVYALRVIFLIEKRVMSIETNIQRLATKVLEEEMKIEREESKIQKALLGRRKVQKKRKRR